MPISFGSFGDIVTVLQLAWQLRALLADAAAPCSEIRALISDVDSFTRALQQVRASIEGRTVPLAPEVVNGIRHAVTCCHDVLQRVLEKVSVFRTRIQSRLGATAWRQYWAVTAWSILGERKEVDALRVRLSEQVGVIQTYLALSHASDQARLHAEVERQGPSMDRIVAVMEDIQLRFDVGVPSFHFYDAWSGVCRKPIARTSFARWHDLFGHADPYGVRLDVLTNGLQVPYGYEMAGEILVMNNVLVNFGGPMIVTCMSIDLCIFKEHAFDQWQVLVGPGDHPPPLLSSLMVLLQRKHRRNQMCDCTSSSCRDQRRLRRRAEYATKMWRAAVGLVNQMTALYSRTQSEGRTDQFSDIRDLLLGSVGLGTRPEENYLSTHVIPLLKLYTECERPSTIAIERIMCAAPRATNRGQLCATIGQFRPPEDSWELQQPYDSIYWSIQGSDPLNALL